MYELHQAPQKVPNSPFLMYLVKYGDTAGHNLCLYIIIRPLQGNFDVQFYMMKSPVRLTSLIRLHHTFSWSHCATATVEKTSYIVKQTKIN